MQVVLTPNEFWKRYYMTVEQRAASIIDDFFDEIVENSKIGEYTEIRICSAESYFDDIIGILLSKQWEIKVIHKTTKDCASCQNVSCNRAFKIRTVCKDKLQRYEPA